MIHPAIYPARHEGVMLDLRQSRWRLIPRRGLARGLVVALPASVALWALVLWAVVS